MSKPEFCRPVPIDRVMRNDLDETVKANEAERTAIALRLKIEAVASLTGSFALRYVRDLATFEVEGEGEAGISQICVVTGEAFDSRVAATVRARFTTDHSLLNGGQPDVFSEWDDLEAVEGGAIDLGELAVQHIALALDPYPRKPGVEWVEKEDRIKPLSPFAVLEGLKKD